MIMTSFMGFVFFIIPLLLIVFVFRWIRFIYMNSEEQIKQNEKIIALLSDIKKQNEK